MQKRSIPVCIILSIVTCGIYAIYWQYTIALAFYEARTQSTLPTTPGVTILLEIVTCNVYGIYAYYKWGQATPELLYRYNLPAEDRSMVYLLLSIFGLSIVNNAIIQNDFNMIIDRSYGQYGQYGQGQ